MKKGFTLIEVLIVVAIIGILAGIILAGLGASREAAKVAKAKTEMKQIWNAAEVVNTLYGYYPNDSHGSIICPRDIVIDPASGRTWGDFINVCEDPWGNPYEWNNTCIGGATRKPHAPYDPLCPSFSDTSQNALGITLVGSNGVNDGCDQDDVCFGNDAHSKYGWGSEGSCSTSVSSCSGLSVGQCTSRQGCSVTASACSGTYSSSCSTISDQTSCQNQNSCSWNVTNSCVGTYNCNQWNGTNAATCTTGHSCTWSTAQGGRCNGGNNSCTGFSQGACTPVGCSVSSSGSCQGSFSSSCSVYNSNQASCQATSGCSWSGQACSGTASTCTGITEENSCNLQAGCLWQ